jgi:hypothetical protein
MLAGARGSFVTAFPMPLPRAIVSWGPALLTVAAAIYLGARQPKLVVSDRPPLPAPASPAEPPAPEDLPRRITAAQSDAYFEGLLPSYPKLEFTPLGESLVANGVPVRVAVGVTRDPAEQVLSFFQAELKHRGLVPTRRTYPDGTSMVGAVDEQRKRVVSVSTLPQGDGEVEVRAVVADVNRGQFSFAMPDDLPFMVGSGGFFFTESVDSGSRSRTIQSVNFASLGMNADFYLKSLESRGWQMESDLAPTIGQKGRSLRFRREGAEEDADLLVSMEPLSGDSGTSVFLTLRTAAKGDLP